MSEEDVEQVIRRRLRELSILIIVFSHPRKGLAWYDKVVFQFLLLYS